MRIFQQNVFNVKMKIRATQTFFQGCSDFTSAFLTLKIAFLVQRDINPGWLKADSEDNYLISSDQQVEGG